MASAQEISENVKQARDQALVGNYEDARVFYAGAIQGVQQLLKQTLEPEKKQNWRQVRSWLVHLRWGVFPFSKQILKRY